MRNRQLGVIGAFFFLIFCFYSISRTSPDGLRAPLQQGAPAQGPPKPPEIVTFTSKKFAATKPKPAPGGRHPIWHLITDAEREFKAVKARQSQTLRDAVAEYRRRYGLPPPPHFDKWWAFAQNKKVQLVDEFDTIHELLTPFWGLKPSTIRARAREALGADNQLMGLQVRSGNASHFFGGYDWSDWMKTALIGMMKDFVEHLPDMDLVFNINDEPRVLVPHDDMARLVHTAQTTAMPAANAAKELRNGFTAKPSDLNYNDRFDEVKKTRFNFFAHSPVWTHSRMSCPPDSPSRILEEDDQFDDIEKYAVSDLGFVANWTAMSDICLSPSLGSTYGFFERPNAYGVVHDLFPIFSQSKISSYADITYPSPWYWAGKVPYAEGNDPAWSAKHDRLYWRGSTTGGFSRDGGWRRQHRQRFVQKINAPDQAKILVPPADTTPDTTDPSIPDTPQSPQQQWTTVETPRGDYKPLLDVYFSHIGQCDPGDCDAQRAFFPIKKYAKQEDALQYKHVLDIDGNAFSGRFYAFLRSRSLVYKWAIFREWHFEWLRPWVHFVPLSLHGEEWLEVVRFFAASGEQKGEGETKKGGELGGEEAERMALRGREWAEKALRNEDLEVWFFRLLLEYGRVVDDDRENIGYAG
ncbi:glycosyltransferase [Parachaetomium inaequale]|uniref:Glycosyltransferase n=1 Tax=Parachaetomium inaequale TaxID=2588326 RepID=A0AAN6SN31_9PEZI|nr:glycosyltransferase [Parachaetomium inaequale]